MRAKTSSPQNREVPLSRVAFTAAPYFSLTSLNGNAPQPFRPRTVAASSAYSDGRLFRFRSSSLGVWAEKEARNARRDTMIIVAQNVVAEMEEAERQASETHQRELRAKSSHALNRSPSREKVRKRFPTAMGTTRADARALKSSNIKFGQPRTPVSNLKEKQFDFITTLGEDEAHEERTDTMLLESSHTVPLKTLLLKPPENRTQSDLVSMAQQLLPLSKFLRTIPMHVMIELCRCVTYFVLEKHEPIFREGDVAHEMFIVLTGRLELYQQMEKDSMGSPPMMKPLYSVPMLKSIKRHLYILLNEIDHTEIPISAKFGAMAKTAPPPLNDIGKHYGVGTLEEALETETEDDLPFLLSPTSLSLLVPFSPVPSTPSSLSPKNFDTPLRKKSKLIVEDFSTVMKEVGTVAPKSSNFLFPPNYLSHIGSRATISMLKKKVGWYRQLLMCVQAEINLTLLKERNKFAEEVKMGQQAQLNNIVAGSVLGEIALEKSDCKRTATPIAEMQCELIKISRKDYKSKLQKQVDIYNETTARFLSRIAVFSKISKDVLMSLVPYLQQIDLQSGHILYEEGQQSNGFLYLIMTGEISFSRSIKQYEPKPLREEMSKLVVKKTLEEIAQTDLSALDEREERPWRPKQITVGTMGVHDVVHMDSYLTHKPTKSSDTVFVSSATCTLLRVSHVDVRKKFLPILGQGHSSFKKLLEIRNERHQVMVDAVMDLGELTKPTEKPLVKTINISRVLEVAPGPKEDFRIGKKLQGDREEREREAAAKLCTKETAKEEKQKKLLEYTRVKLQPLSPPGSPLSPPPLPDDDAFSSVPLRHRKYISMMTEIEKLKPPKVVAEVVEGYAASPSPKFENRSTESKPSMGDECCRSDPGIRARHKSTGAIDRFVKIADTHEDEPIREGAEAQDRLELELREVKTASKSRDIRMKKLSVLKKELQGELEHDIETGLSRFKSDDTLHKYAAVNNALFSATASSAALERFDDQYRRAMGILRTGMEARIAIERNGSYTAAEEPTPTPIKPRATSPILLQPISADPAKKPAVDLRQWVEEQWSGIGDSNKGRHQNLNAQTRKKKGRTPHIAIDVEYQKYATVTNSPRELKMVQNQMSINNQDCRIWSAD